MSITFNNHSGQVRQAMKRAKQTALTAIGIEAVGVTVRYMQSNYGAPIIQTGDLQRDVNSKVRGDVVDIGNSLDYSAFVHNGTARMPARPYLKDALSENANVWKEIASEYIDAEFE